MIGGRGTLGGAVATGWSGPGRPWRGAVRDAVLGVEMINGLGERLTFGGQVMKNVAGYDPLPSAGRRLGELGHSAVDQRAGHSRGPCGAHLPVGVCCRRSAFPHARLGARAFADHRHLLRRRRAQRAAVRDGRERGGGGRTHRRGASAGLHPLARSSRPAHCPVFASQGGDGQRLWQIHCAPAAELPPGACLVEWSGARRWWRTDARGEDVRAYAEQAGGGGAAGRCPPRSSIRHTWRVLSGPSIPNACSIPI